MSGEQPRNIRGLLQPVGGMLYKFNRILGARDEPRLSYSVANTGTMNEVLNKARPGIIPATRLSFTGFGSATDPGRSELPALGELLERYSAAVFDPSEFVTDTAYGLGNACLDLDSIPRCSEHEYADAKCPLVAPRKDAPIRWVRSLNLTSSIREEFIPAAMVHLYMRPVNQNERIANPISTGCAAHPCLERAILNGIYEVVERDAISILWLQRLVVPRIQFDTVPVELEPEWDAYMASSNQLEYMAFNASLDLEIPIVYSIQRSHTDAALTTLVSCSAGSCYSTAIAKVFRDMGIFRAGFPRDRQIPAAIEDFHEPHHGAVYMATRRRSHAFDFLTKQADTEPLSRLRSAQFDDDKDELKYILDLFRARDMNVYLVDLTTREARAVGMWVIRIIIPALQPLSFQHRARFLGHPRLYDVPRELRSIAFPETNLNPWPQPFA